MLFDLLGVLAGGSISQEPSIGLRDLDDDERMPVKEAAGLRVMAEAALASATLDLPTMLLMAAEAAG